MTEAEYISEALEYIQILSDHHVMFDGDNNKGVTWLMSNALKIFETLPIMMEQVTNVLDPGSNASRDVKDQFGLDQLKYFANVCLFIDAMSPLCSKYNPSEEDKKKFLEFIGYTPEE